MAQRKIDRIKDLEDQIRGLTNQRDHEHDRAKKLERELEELRRGSDEFLLICNAVLLGTTKRYGRAVGENGRITGFELTVPKVDVKDYNERYDVRVELKDEEYVVTMRPRKKGENNGNV